MQRYDVVQQTRLLLTLNSEAPNNDDQQTVYDAINNAVDAITDPDSPATFIFVKGQGGCGKTTIAKKIVA
jgi:tRNA A37 threonylcarbamoyladenosine biosynthesis protein TsaE